MGEPMMLSSPKRKRLSSKLAKKRKGPHKAHRFPPSSRKARVAASSSYSLKAKPRRVRVFPPKKKTVFLKKRLPKKHPKFVDKQIKLARTYKRRGRKSASALSRRYNKEINSRYKDKEKREAIKRYRLTAKARKLHEEEVIRLHGKKGRGKNRGKYFVKYKMHPKGIWMTPKQFSGLTYRTKRKPIIEHYKNLYGLTTKEALALYKSMRGRWGYFVKAALY